MGFEFLDMVRNLLVLLVFLGVGFGANVAQSDIFVRKSPKEEVTRDADKDGSKPSKPAIFLRRFRDAIKNPAAKNRYGTTLDTQGLRRQLVKDMKLLAYWQQSGRKPAGLKELAAYAVAMRSENFKNMLVEQNKILPRLISAHRARFDKVAAQIKMQAPDTERIAEIDAMIMAGLPDQIEPPQAVQAVKAVYQKPLEPVEGIQSAVKAPEPPPEAARRSVRKSTPIYIRKEDDAQKKPSDAASRVYKNYR